MTTDFQVPEEHKAEGINALDHVVDVTNVHPDDVREYMELMIKTPEGDYERHDWDTMIYPDDDVKVIPNIAGGC